MKDGNEMCHRDYYIVLQRLLLKCVTKIIKVCYKDH